MTVEAMEITKNETRRYSEGDMMEITKEEAQVRFPAVRECYLNSIFRYSEEGVPTGGFLTRVLANDLFGAIFYYSGNSFQELRQMICLIHGYMPSRHHGSAGKVNAHIKQQAQAHFEE